MTNKNKQTRQEKPEKVKPTYKTLLESEKAKYLEALQKKYPKHPKPILEMIIKVYEKQLYGTEEEKFYIQNLMEQIPKQPDLSYFGKNGFQPQEEFIENKGMEVLIKECAPAHTGVFTDNDLKEKVE